MLKPRRVRIYRSQTYNTSVNLALEEYFMNSVAEDEWILFWWQSDNTVVIGRNQNPYQECNLEKMHKDAVKLVRRLSGGGAVYHDLGNLNFSFISKGDLFNPDLHFEILLKGLSLLGITGCFNGRNDLIAQGRKFSGNAFIHEEDKHLHHGTLLINANVDKLSQYLMVSHEKLDTKGFDSVKSRVINLNELSASISTQKIIRAVDQSVKDNLGAEIIHGNVDALISLKAKVFLDKYESNAWNYGDMSNFSIKKQKRYTWGELCLSLEVEDGMISKIKVTTDALEAEAFSNLMPLLKGSDLLPDTLFKKIEESGLSSQMGEDVYDLIVDMALK